MSGRTHPRWVSGSRDGIALILVLAFIVLITILILSFISFSRLNRMSTASYSKSIQAQEIAQGGLEDVISDLHQEIVAGSTNIAATTYGGINGGIASNPLVYVPATNWTAQPAHFGYNPTFYGTDVTSTNLPPTLLRVSRASQDGTPTDFYPNLPSYYAAGLLTNRASAANTATNSINGRNISAARWNKIALLATNTTIAPAFATNTPDWVYVTRAGSRVCTDADVTSAAVGLKPGPSLTTTTAVVGRYAYAVYDEGALLDVNAAGYISSATNSYAVTPPPTVYTDPVTGITQVVTSKTYSSYADLTQLPGLASSSGGQNVVDNLIKWRDASVTGMTGTTFYQASFTNAKNGFKTFSSGDSPLLSRQDLINYFAQIDPNGTSSSAALPFLGTFTRAANAPSWSPAADSTALPGYYPGTFTGIAPVKYKTNAETAPNPNRDLPNVRYPASTPSGTLITHYDDGGNQTPYTVNPGDPLVQHRFSLAKLAWLTYQGPKTTTLALGPIQACFGLVWGANPEKNPCWEYVGPTGNKPQSQIETLDQVAAETPPREPNFFELLKAGILSGSLGQTPGPVVGTSSGYGSGNWINSSNTIDVDGVAGLGFDAYSTDKDRHILQIGANIIDQSDSDSYPTAIYMALRATSLPEDDLCLNMVYGDENLPSIARILTFSIESPATYIKTWFQPEIWNLHQAPATGVTLPYYPASFRLHAYGKVHTQAGLQGPGYDFSPSLDYDSTANYTGGSETSACNQYALISFADANGGTAASTFYSYPVRLDSSLSPGVSFPSPSPAVNYWGVPKIGPVLGLPLDSGSTNADEKFVAFFAGETHTDLTSTTDPPSSAPWSSATPLASYLNMYCFPENPLYFSIEYQDPNNSNSWLPYGFISRIDEQLSFGQSYYIQTGGNYGTSGPVQGSTYPEWCLNHPDPRTDRFSCVESAPPGIGNWGVDFSIDSGPGTHPVTGLVQNTPEFGSNEFPLRSYGFNYLPALPSPDTWHGGDGVGGGGQYYGFWAENQSIITGTLNAFYIDPDGVVRPGDGYRRNSNTVRSSGKYSNSSTGDGDLLWVGFATTSPTSTLPSTTGASPSGSAQARRPMILNRPFRSVAELGYAYRDVPFKTLDFFSGDSADAALLDLFSVTDEPTIAAGEVDVSNAPASVLGAILAGTSKMEINNPASGANFVSSTDAVTAAAAASSYLKQNGPLVSRADLVTKLSDPLFTSLWSSTGTNANYANKAYAEAPVRALSDVASTRTWNLLIDIIAQSGFMATNATTLNDFTVAGERRYWLHLSIDRYTGKIIDQQLEPVYE